MSLSKINRGGFGVVYSLDGLAAKTPFSESELELLILCQNHPNVIRYEGVKEIGSKQYLLTERMLMSLSNFRRIKRYAYPELAQSYAWKLLSRLDESCSRRH